MEYNAPIMRSNQFISDTVSAIAASFAVSPFITIIDKSIILNAAGAMSIRSALKQGTIEAMAKPHVFITKPEFVITWALYYVTYQTAHTVSSICENMEVDQKYPKFASTTLVNATACVLKDRSFARMFGTKLPTKLPAASYALFFTRDCATNFASFTLPPIAAKYIEKDFGVSQDRALSMAQLACPVGIQIFSSPLHLLGLNLYNAPNATLRERFTTCSSQYVATTVARCSRIFPAFGIGGELSRRFRNSLREYTGVTKNLASA